MSKKSSNKKKKSKKIKGKKQQIKKQENKNVGTLNQSLSKKFKYPRFTKNSADLQKQMKGLQTIFVSLGKAAAAKGIPALVNLSTNVASNAKSMTEAADKVGFTTKSFQEFNHVASLSNISNKSFTDGLSTMNKQILKIKDGSDTDLEFMKSIPQDLLESIKTSDNNEKIFNKILEVINNFDNHEDKKLLADKFFGASGSDMKSIASLSNEEIHKGRQNAHKTGNVISSKDIQAAEKLNKSMLGLSLATQGLGKTIATKLFPIITPLIEKISSWIERNRELIATKLGECLEKVFNAFDDNLLDNLLVTMCSLVGLFTSLSAVLLNFSDLIPLAAILVAASMLISFVSTLATFFVTLGSLFTFLMAHPVILIIAGVLAAAYAIYKIFKWLGKRKDKNSKENPDITEESFKDVKDLQKKTMFTEPSSYNLADDYALQNNPNAQSPVEIISKSKPPINLDSIKIMKPLAESSSLNRNNPSYHKYDQNSNLGKGNLVSLSSKENTALPSKAEITLIVKGLPKGAFIETQLKTQNYDLDLGTVCGSALPYNLS